MQRHHKGTARGTAIELTPKVRASGLCHVAIAAIGLLFAASATLAETAAPAVAADTRSLSFDIPAGPLETVLERFAAETGVSLSFSPADVQGKRSEGVHGSYTAANALTVLLHNTGLNNAIQSARGYELKVAPATPAAPASQSGVTESIVLPPVHVSAAAPREGDFAALSTSSVTRTATPVFYIPQSVAVITPALIQSQQLQSVGDALRDVSGITIFSANGVAGSAGGVPYVRGLLAVVMKNGMPALAPDSTLNLPVAALSGIEVIKGADSIVSGSTPPSGIVNVTTKQPQSTPVHELTVQAGSYGDWLSSIDLAGPIGNDPHLTYRFVLSGETAARDFFAQDGQRNFYVAPSIAYDNGKTRLVVGFEQHAFSQDVPPYTVLFPSGPLEVNSPLVNPAGRFFGNDTEVSYDLTQRLGNALSFHSQARYNAQKSYLPSAWDLLTVSSLSPLTGVYVPLQYRLQTNNLSLDNNLKLVLQTGPVKHTLLFGMTYSRTTQTLNQASGNEITAPIPWQNSPAPITSFVEPGVDSSTLSNTFYLQDQIAWNSLHILASISRSAQWGTDQQSQSAWSPNIGVLYQFTESVAAYANVQRSFYTQPFFSATGGATPPEIGRSAEIGLKFDSPEARYTGTVAVFRSAEYNSATPDPVNPGLYDVVPSGYVSRGVEADVTGHLLPGWKLSASYTYADLTSPPGTGITQLPKHTFSLWTTYDLQSERWRGWGAGIGIRARSSYTSSDSAGNILSIPGQLRTDASLYYHARKWSTTLGVKNLFDRRLYADYARGQFVEVQPTRVFYLTGMYDF